MVLEPLGERPRNEPVGPVFSWELRELLVEAAHALPLTFVSVLLPLLIEGLLVAPSLLGLLRRVRKTPSSATNAASTAPYPG